MTGKLSLRAVENPPNAHSVGPAFQQIAKKALSEAKRSEDGSAGPSVHNSTETTDDHSPENYSGDPVIGVYEYWGGWGP